LHCAGRRQKNTKNGIVTQNVGHMLVDLPTGCEFGAKKNSKGYKGSARLAADCRYRRHMSPRAILPY
jgi:hypothetical protein